MDLPPRLVREESDIAVSLTKSHEENNLAAKRKSLASGGGTLRYGSGGTKPLDTLNPEELMLLNEQSE